MIRVAKYKRVSTDDQAREGFSLPAQDERLEAFAKAQGWVVVGDYTDDGFSGRNTNRPAYQRMMEEHDRWDLVLVLKMDRIHRNSRNFTDMMELLARRGQEFASVTESLDTSTAMGRFVMDTIVRIAQLESEQTGERVLVGMEQKAKLGAGGNGGHAPFGYRWKDGRLEVDETEAPVVRLIFKLAKELVHESGKVYFGEIADTLNGRRLRTRSGKPWTYWSVRRLYGNIAYQGHLRWKGTLQKNAHRPLTSPTKS